GAHRGAAGRGVRRTAPHAPLLRLPPHRRRHRLVPAVRPAVQLPARPRGHRALRQHPRPPRRRAPTVRHRPRRRVVGLAARRREAGRAGRGHRGPYGGRRMAPSIAHVTLAANEASEHRTLIIFLFALFVVATLGITVWAGRQTKSASDFYAGGRQFSAFQNGLAVSGDYMSAARSEEHTSELQSRENLVCRLLLEKKNTNTQQLSN